MSLINDALKKAQRQRTQTPYDAVPPMPGGGPVPRRGAPMAAQTIVLIAVGCVVLVAISIGVTIFLVRGKAPAAAAAPITTVAKVETVAPKVATPLPQPLLPPIIAPAPASEKSPVTTESTPAKSPLAEAKPESRPAPPPVKTPVAVVEEAPKKAPAPVGTAAPEEKVQAFLDALLVRGVRASGTDSRALLNERVYRINDLVDRTLGLRLTKVETDSLTFTDPHGVVYVKQF